MWRELAPRPLLECSISRVAYSRWSRYAPYHYLTAELHRGATCFELEAGGQPAAFAAILHRPHPGATGHKVRGVSRVVTLPDWQGLGLAFALLDRLGGAYNALGMELHMYPAHPPLIRSFDRSPTWTLLQRPGQIKKRPGRHWRWNAGVRPNAVFRYCGGPTDELQARALIRGES